VNASGHDGGFAAAGKRRVFYIHNGRGALTRNGCCARRASGICGSGSSAAHSAVAAQTQ